MPREPRIAVLLDENTSGGGDRYEAAKGYFEGAAAAGGLPFGVPYVPGIVAAVLDGFDGLLTCGAALPTRTVGTCRARCPSC